MSDNTSDQEVKRWKQQYYDHLDQHERAQKDWQALESILKKTVLRLSIAAEGQHTSIDRHLQDIRSVVKKQVDVYRLEHILEDLSALLLKIGDRQAAEDKKVIGLLVSLLKELDLPAAIDRQKNSLLKKLAKATDKEIDTLVAETQGLISSAIVQSAVGQSAGRVQAESKPGLLSGLFGSGDKTNPITTETHPVVPDAGVAAGQREHRQGQSTSPGIGLSSPSVVAHDTSADESEPSIREILIRLLEQIIVPADLQEDVESLKTRIENQGSDTSWKQLLKDVAQLINALRSRLQEEKQEFESFLQQITARLKEMDGFLAIENASLNEAEQAADAFDVVVQAQVKDIHDDMHTANDLDDLKNRVETRLNVVSAHIRQYRISEHERYTSAQRNVEDMQSRLVLLEQESGDLRRLILEKNKEAMFDALTGIPNRLSYEKKAVEEIARCHRFATPLSMAVWDVDLFKTVNDTYGHKVGDRVLKVIAQLLDDRMRETDFIARYGGEEFVMFLPGANETEALELANVLREKIASSKFYHDGDTVKITVSCGISSFVKGDSHESMFERADKALYAAKHNGRNQCVGASSLT
jgi:diguanylate cyclase